MKRREALKGLIVFAGGITLLPSCLNNKGKASIALKNFQISADQERLLAEIASTIIPKTDTPGAKEMGSHLFVLKMLDDCYEKDVQQKFVQGLNQLENSTKKHFGNSFVNCTVDQKENVLRGVENKEAYLPEVHDFYNIMKERTNKNNLLAYQYLVTAHRKLKDTKQADSIIKVLLTIDPLNHYARFEQYLIRPAPAALEAFRSQIKNELPHETYLELAVTYANQGLDDEAIKVLEQAPSYPTVFYWLAYLKRNTSPNESLAYLKEAEELSPRLVFPFRLETIPVLTWASEKHASWKTSYYLGLVYWNNLRIDKAKELFEKCEETPDFAPFYLARGALFQGDSAKSIYVGQNFERAIKLEPTEWRTWHYRSNYLMNNNLFEQCYIVSKQAYKSFKTNPVIAMDYAKALLNSNRLEDCLEVLKEVLVLPQEGAQEGHEIYELANLSLALKMIEQKKYQTAIDYLNNSEKWPENLGTGSPYNPDNRLQDFVLAYCEKKIGNQKEAGNYNNQILAYSKNQEIWSGSRNTSDNYISALILIKQEKQQELTKLMTSWKSEQDSLSNWNISTGSAAPEFQWVWAKYNKENKRVAVLEKELASNSMTTRFELFVKALELISK